MLSARAVHGRAALSTIIVRRKRGRPLCMACSQVPIPTGGIGATMLLCLSDEMSAALPNCRREGAFVYWQRSTRTCETNELDEREGRCQKC